MYDASLSDGFKRNVKDFTIAVVSSCAPLFVAWAIEELKSWRSARKSKQ